MGGRINSSSEATDTTTGVNESTSTSSQGGGTGRTGGTASGRNNSTGKQSETVPKGVLVDLPDGGGDSNKEEKPKPPRGRPKGSTTKQTPRKTTAAKKNQKADTTQIKLLLLTVSGIIASRPNMEVWAMTGDEIDQIIEPLSSILAKHNVGEATSEYADYIALVISLFVIFVPKYLMWKQTQPKKEKKPNVTRTATNTPVESGEVTGSSKGNGGVIASNGTSFGEQLHGLIHPIGGI